jgi:PKD repeat protein
LAIPKYKTKEQKPCSSKMVVASSKTILTVPLWLCIGLFVPLTSRADFLPPGFIKEFVVNVPATSGTWAPNPRRNGQPMLLVVSKSGQILVLEDPDNSSEHFTIVDLGPDEICTNGERGLQSAVPHSSFPTTPWLYLFYAKFREGCLEDPQQGAYNVVARFRMDPETLQLDKNSREEIWRGAPTTKKVHNGGAMAFGFDGKLYVTTGDGGDSRNSQPLNNTHGSIIRINDDGTVPSDNPYWTQDAVRCADTGGVTSQDKKCPEVFAHGFRNPFRLSVDHRELEQAKDKFTVSDVGGNYWEELDFVGTDFAGKNYGYPMNEGVCWHGSATRCPTPTDSNLIEPFHWYAHLGTDEGGCVSGSVHVPESLGWPSQYKFLFGDFIFKEIYSLTEDPDSGCRSCRPPTSGYRNETFFRVDNDNPDESRITDIFFAPYNNTQALYVITRGGDEAVVRIRHTDVVDNAPPIPQIVLPELENGIYSVGEELKFNGSGSSDPDGDVLSFFWEFGDGITSEETSPAHSYGMPGQYTVTLTVTDTMDQEQQTSETIMVGHPPRTIITSPGEDDVFRVGQVFQLRGLAFDLMGVAIPNEQLVWEVRQHHAEHYHPFLDPTSGNNIELFPAPEPEDFFASTNSYLRVILKATDFNGLSSEVDLLVQPKKVSVQIESQPPGIEIYVENYPVMTSSEIISWEGHNLRVFAPGQSPYVFKAWLDGVTDAERTIKITKDNQEVLALYCAQDLWFCVSPEECCSGICVSNTCHADEAAVVTDVFEEPSGGSVEDDIMDSEEPSDLAEDEIMDSPVAKIVTTEDQHLGTLGKAIIVLLCLTLIAVAFLVCFLRRKKRRLEERPGSSLPKKQVTSNKNTARFQNAKALQAKSSTLPMFAASTASKKCLVASTKKRDNAMTKEDFEAASIAMGSNANTTWDAGSSSASVASQESSTNDDLRDLEAASIDESHTTHDVRKYDDHEDLGTKKEAADDPRLSLSNTTNIEEEVVFISEESVPPQPQKALRRVSSLECNQDFTFSQSPSSPSSSCINTSLVQATHVLKEELSQSQSHNHELEQRLRDVDHPPSPFPHKSTNCKIQDLRLELEQVQNRNKELSKRIAATKSRVS